MQMALAFVPETIPAPSDPHMTAKRKRAWRIYNSRLADLAKQQAKADADARLLKLAAKAHKAK